jgi:GNAT superfamily N-acetyltransferase
VSPDAVLLTTAKILPEFTGQGLARYLMNGVVNALTRRGVRAIEVFGLESDPLPDPEDPQAAPVELAPDPGLPRCLLPAGFARAVGFEDVAPHFRYPRLRFELGRDIGWKAEVESALEKLFTVIRVPASPSPLVPELVGQR